MENGKNNLAYVCSPYRGNIVKRIRNILYARALTKCALDLGYTPITTHLYMTQVLKDTKPEQRQQGLKAGKEILESCDTIIIGARYGISAGMAGEIADAKRKHKEVVIMLWKKGAHGYDTRIKDITGIFQRKCSGHKEF